MYARLITVLGLLLEFSGPLGAATLHQKAPPTPLAQRGNVVLVNFWASWCAPCQAELPALRQLADDYRGQRVQVLAVNVDNDPAAARRLLKKLGLSNSRLQVVWDTKSKIVGAYNIPTMPSSYIVDKKGVVRFIHAGFRPDDPVAWRNEINRLL